MKYVGLIALLILTACPSTSEDIRYEVDCRAEGNVVMPLSRQCLTPTAACARVLRIRTAKEVALITEQKLSGSELVTTLNEAMKPYAKLLEEASCPSE